MPTHPLPPKDLVLLRWAQGPQLSPDGAAVAWSEIALDMERDEPVSAVYVAPSDGTGEPRRFTSGPHDMSPRWSPDGRYLAYLSASDGPPALRLAPLAGGVPASVAAPGPVKAFEWSPAGDRLVLVVCVREGTVSDAVAQNAPRVIRGLFNRMDGLGWLEGRDHLFVHDVASGTTSRLTSGEYDHASPAWSPDGSTIAFVSDRSRRRDDRAALGDVWLLDAGGRRTPRRLVTDVIFAGALQFSPDGARLAFSGIPDRTQRAARDTRLMVAAVDGGDRAGGEQRPEVVAPALDRPAAYGFAQQAYGWLGPDELIFAVADAGTIGIRRSRLGERSARAVVEGDRQVLGLSVFSSRNGSGGSARSGRTLVAFASAWVDCPGEVHVLDITRRGRDPVRVSRASEPLCSAVALRPAERLRATAPDGREIEYFAIRPAGAGRPAPPLFVEIHGGPAMQNPIVQLLPHYQVLAGAGYTVILPNPRGSIGYGEKFTSMSLGDWGDGPFADIIACADDAIERGLGDGGRQFVGGYSYGGYMSAFAVGHTNRFKAAAIGAPVVNLASEIGSADIGRFLAEAIGADPWSSPDLLEANSPISHAPAVTTPVLLYVNDGDLRCPPSQCDELYTALKWHGREVEYVRYPGGSHLSVFAIAGAPSQAEDRSRRILEWLARHGGVSSADGASQRAPRVRKAAGSPRTARGRARRPARRPGT